MDDDELDFLAEVIHRAIQGHHVEIACRTARDTTFWFRHLTRTLDDIDLPYDAFRSVGHQMVVVGSEGIDDGGMSFATLSDRMRMGTRANRFYLAP